jgi:hypothetical protein
MPQRISTFVHTLLGLDLCGPKECLAGGNKSKGTRDIGSHLSIGRNIHSTLRAFQNCKPTLNMPEVAGLELVWELVLALAWEPALALASELGLELALNPPWGHRTPIGKTD